MVHRQLFRWRYQKDCNCHLLTRVVSGCVPAVSTASAVTLLSVSAIPNGLDIINCAMHRIASGQENSARDGQHYEKFFHRPFPLRSPEPHLAPGLNGERNRQRQDLFHQPGLVIGAEWIKTSATRHCQANAKDLSVDCR